MPPGNYDKNKSKILLNYLLFLHLWQNWYKITTVAAFKVFLLSKCKTSNPRNVNCENMSRGNISRGNLKRLCLPVCTMKRLSRCRGQWR